MTPVFWKLSQGPDYFVFADILRSISDRLVHVHKDTPAKGRSADTQGDDFVKALVGDYFYLTHGNQGIYVLGQFTGPANLFSIRREGWLDRPFRPIQFACKQASYAGPAKRWAPSDNSTFICVPDDEVGLFEVELLRPFFDIRLSDVGIKGAG